MYLKSVRDICANQLEPLPLDVCLPSPIPLALESTPHSPSKERSVSRSLEKGHSLSRNREDDFVQRTKTFECHDNSLQNIKVCYKTAPLLTLCFSYKI
jgi:hypothetical protein